MPSRVPGQHYQCDVREVLYEPWDLIIAFPPCTYLTNSGVGHLHKDPSRWFGLEDACEFFNLFLDYEKLNCKGSVVENPVPHKYAKELLSASYSQIIQPYEHGNAQQKKTCLWVHGVPLLKPSYNVKSLFEKLPKRVTDRTHRMPPGPDRQKKRSETYPGVALAMAAQWTEYFYDQAAGE